MSWCWLDQLLRGWLTQAQDFSGFPALQINASATRISAISESLSFGFGPSIHQSSKKDFFKK